MEKTIFKNPLFYFNIFLVVVVLLLVASINVGQAKLPDFAKKVIAAIQNITGEGQTNYLAAFTGTNQIGNSIIYDNGTNVGIGTTNPQATLHIVGNSSDRVGMYITNQGSGPAGLAVFRGSQYKGAVFAASDQDSFIIKTGDQNGPLRLQVGKQDRVWITADGKVGIGTGNPQATLHIAGDSGNVGMYITNQGSGAAGLAVFRQGQYKGAVFAASDQDSFIIKTGDQNGPLRLQVGKEDRVWITANGNVGIGTTAPTQKLDVNGYVKGTGLCIGDDCRASWPTLTCTTVSNGANGDVTVTCPTGYTVTGGGCSNTGDSRMYNIPSGNGWYCGGTDTSYRTVYAVCCR